MCGRAFAALTLIACLAGGARAFELMDVGYEPHEEPMGSGFLAMLNPEDEAYQRRLGFEQWLRGTPLFGEYFLLGLLNDKMGSNYLGLGITIRAMPTGWLVAPFIGGGGSANYSTYDVKDNPGAAPKEHSKTYGVVIAEAGLRLAPRSAPLYFEAIAQYNHVPAYSDQGYWLAGLGMGWRM